MAPPEIKTLPQATSLSLNYSNILRTSELWLFRIVNMPCQHSPAPPPRPLPVSLSPLHGVFRPTIQHDPI